MVYEACPSDMKMTETLMLPGMHIYKQSGVFHKADKYNVFPLPLPSASLSQKEYAKPQNLPLLFKVMRFWFPKYFWKQSSSFQLRENANIEWLPPWLQNLAL